MNGSICFNMQFYNNNLNPDLMMCHMGKKKERKHNL